MDDKFLFGDNLSFEIMFIKGDKVPHILNTATRFSAALFINKIGAIYERTVEKIWEVFVMT